MEYLLMTGVIILGVVVLVGAVVYLSMLAQGMSH